MADAVISVLLDQLASIAREQVEEKVRLVMGVDNEVENLRRNLEAIRTVLKDAEKRQLKDDGVKLWLEDLKDVSYDMDSVLDEWITAILKSEAEKEEHGVDSSSPDDRISKRKVCFSVLFSCFKCCKQTQQAITHRLDIALKIQSLNEKIDSISTRKNTFSFSITSGSDVDEPKRPKSVSFLDVPVVYGQGYHKQVLIDRLMSGESSQVEGNQELRAIQFIPIVGMGGIGKTTLAKHVYNDDKVKEHFGGQRIWVCVSDPFNRDQIVKEITEQLNGPTPATDGPEVLMQKFLQSIEGQKFLLVLDDVWTSNYNEWAPLEQALRRGDVESRVVVTTRNPDVAQMVGDRHVIWMNKLSDKDCWLLLSEIAFSGKTNEEREDFEGISWEIASKCDGLPLAAKTLGGLLRVKDTKDWLHVLESDIWALQDVKDSKNVKENLFRPLLLSYYDLPDLEKLCFTYCAIFPKDYKIDREDLIQQWIAQGYFKSEKSEDVEGVGQRCFQNLAMRSFFQDFEYDESWDESTVECKMHDIVHDFAHFLTLNEYCTVLIADAREKVELSTRHLNLTIPWTVKLPNSISNQKNLHTLMVTYDLRFINMVPDQFLDLSRLRTLSLTGDSMELPTNLGELIHLRYLRLFDIDKYMKLPPTIGNLFNLQTLRICGCRDIIELPEEVGKLINLRHLYIDHERMSFPKGIGRLTSLRTLKRITVSPNNASFQLQDFRGLNSLRDVYVRELGTEEHVEEAVQAKLRDKEDLINLSLFFKDDDTKMETHEKVLGALQPHENLKSLVISYYCGRSISPSWMVSLNNLKRLVLRRCHEYEVLPPLGKLASLESMVIARANSLKKMGPEFLGVEIDPYDDSAISSTSGTLFPKLKELAISRAELLCEWIGVPGWKVNGPLKIMPRLESLFLNQCSLESLPDFLEATPLKRLTILDSPALRSSCEKETGKDWPKIRHAPSIAISWHVAAPASFST